MWWWCRGLSVDRYSEEIVRNGGGSDQSNQVVLNVSVDM